MNNGKPSFFYPTNEKEYLQQVSNLLLQLKECVLDSSEPAWIKASEIVRMLSGMIPLVAYHKIGEIWSESYSNPLTEQDLDKRLEEVFIIVKNSRKK